MRRATIVRAPASEGALERLERLTGVSLDRIEECIREPLESVLRRPQAAMVLNTQVQYVRAVLTTIVRVGVETSRLTSERERLVAELTAREFGAGNGKAGD